MSIDVPVPLYCFLNFTVTILQSKRGMIRCVGICSFLLRYHWYILLILKIVLSLAVIILVPYTEIDWMTYMNQVRLFLDGERDYLLIRGSTGPLVYPAGFLFIFSLLHMATEQGKNILQAQILYALLNIITFAIVSVLNGKADSYPSIRAVFFSLSRRIYSIYMLRLFNDPFAMLLFYISVYLFIEGRWRLGSFVYSLAVSVKMNILLFSPALLILFYFSGNVTHVVVNLLICAGTQIILGAPFLAVSSLSYLKKSFEFDRKFDYFWSVNMKFFPETVFQLNQFSFVLLFCHILLLILFLEKKWKLHGKIDRERLILLSKNRKAVQSKLSSDFILSTLFECNFIGILCSRSLHYQFFSWYFHSLAYLLWNTGMSFVLQLLIFFAIELCWNIYPSTFVSSGLLSIAHFALLLHRYNHVKM